MDSQNRFYIISYDLDNQSFPEKSKRLLEFLRKYHAVCLTKSTWLICTSSDCYTVFKHVLNILEPFSLFSLEAKCLEQQDHDRVFVAEITGNVFSEYLICDEPGSKLTLDQLMKASGSDSIVDGFQTVYGF